MHHARHRPIHAMGAAMVERVGDARCENRVQAPEADSPRSNWLLGGVAPPGLLGPRSRRCHGINYTQNPLSRDE